MVAITTILSLLPLATTAFAAPAPATNIPSNLISNTSIALHTYNEADYAGLAQRAAAIDPNGQSRIVFCNDANRQGQCVDWGQKSHCCMSDSCPRFE
jgi:hypothetical protein